MKHFLSVNDVDNIDALVNEALEHKKNPFAQQHLGNNKRIGIIFLNPSLRTRLSTMIAAQQLGFTPIVLNMNQESWALEFDLDVVMNGNSVEHIADAAPILGQYFDIIAIRTFPSLTDKEKDYSEFTLQQFVKYTGKPVISLESATLHPLQSFADTITITENIQHFKHKPKVVLTWAPHIKAIPQCVSNSFAQWMTAWDQVDLTIAHPEGFELDTQFTQGATITHQQEEALQNADFVYVKNWSSFQDYGKIYENGEHWMLTPEKLHVTNQAKIMHCLPVRRNLELSGSLLDSTSSLVQQQAQNRIWAAQTVIHNIAKSL